MGLRDGIAKLLLAVACAALAGTGFWLYRQRYPAWLPRPGCEAQRWSVQGAADSPVSRIVLVSIDTLRADHLKSYGYVRQTSPFLDQLAAQGVAFEKAFSTVSHTAPSHASMLTGLSPAAHGLLVNGHLLQAEVPTLSCLLEQRGFQTAAFTSVRFLRELTVGFDEVDAERRDGDDTVDAALAWLERLAPDARFFLWVHLYDPHGWQGKKNLRDPAYLEAVRNSTELRGEAFLRYAADLHGFALPQDPDGRMDWDLGEGITAAQALEVVDRYDALIAYSDAQIERLFAAVEGGRFQGDSLWVVTSDHGEAIGSHSHWGHGKHVYNEQLRVPLIFYASKRGWLTPGLRVREVASLVDLLPTLAELLRVEPRDAPAELEGTSLLGPLRGEPLAVAGRIAFSQRRPVDALRRDELGWVDEDVYVAQDGRYKYILRTASEDQFFDLARDPKELRSQVDGPSEPRDALRRRLEQRLVRLAVGAGGARPAVDEVPEDLADELRALGYVE